MNQIYVAVRAAGKSRTVFGSAFAEHDQNHIPHAIPAASPTPQMELLKSFSSTYGKASGVEFTPLSNSNEAIISASKVGF